MGRPIGTIYIADDIIRDHEEMFSHFILGSIPLRVEFLYDRQGFEMTLLSKKLFKEVPQGGLPSRYDVRFKYLIVSDNGTRPEELMLIEKGYLYNPTYIFENHKGERFLDQDRTRLIPQCLQCGSMNCVQCVRDHDKTHRESTVDCKYCEHRDSQ